MAISSLLARASKGNLMQNGYVILDHGGLSRHETSGMIEQDTFPDIGSGMNINCIDSRNQALQVLGQLRAILSP